MHRFSERGGSAEAPRRGGPAEEDIHYVIGEHYAPLESIRDPLPRIDYGMVPFFIISAVLLNSGLVAAGRCSSLEDCAPGFFCADRLPWALYGTCKKLEPGASRCYRNDDCGTDLRCSGFLSNYSCVTLPDYSMSGLPLGFGACNKSYNCGIPCVRNTCSFDCARGRCHISGFDNSCSNGCTSWTTCVRGRCVYGTEGKACDPAALEPCIRGLRCIQRPGETTGVCRKGRIGMPCTNPDRCAPGLVCGTSGKCSRSADGEPCKSDFFCPPGFSCSRAAKKCMPKNVLIGKNESISVPSRAWPCKFHRECSNIYVGGTHISTTHCLNGVCIPEGIGRPCDFTNGPMCPFQLSCFMGKCRPAFEGSENMTLRCLRGLVRKRVCGETCKDLCAKGKVPDYEKLERALSKYDGVASDTLPDENGWHCAN